MKSMLKFLTCGSVDDGKSTLLGHLLYDAKLLFADQRDALLLESKVGSREGSIDYSLLLDGLAAEREQGITIDVAYRYFSTEKRSFIAADCPGHEEYTRNMAVGAGFADLAVILIDASKGVLTQTRRHTRICALMGIRHFVYAVNKMDLIHYDEGEFGQTCSIIEDLITEFPVESLQIIPVSATEGDNVANRSQNMTWYDGPTLQEYIEEVDVTAKEAQGKGFCLPVQRVSRPNSDFRGFQGTITAGSLRIGDAITVLPSGTRSTVTRIIKGFDDVSDAALGDAVTIELNDEIDVSRGCVLVNNYSPIISKAFTAKLLWLDNSPLMAGRSFLFRLGTATVSGTVTKIKHRIDVNSGAEIGCRRVEKNEIALCDIVLSQDSVFDSFASNADLGRLIMIDRVTNMTSACAVIEHPLDRGSNLTWQSTDITRDLRQNHMGQIASTLWFTGLSGSGKSTLANAVEQRLFAEGRFTMLLDGDNVRQGLNNNLGFTEADRAENIRRIAEVSKLMNDAGLITLTSFISPFKEDRLNARRIIGDQSFIEVFVSTPLEECERRDVKGLYAKARSGAIRNFTGISSPYEEPENAEIVVDTSVESLESAVERIVAFLAKHEKERGCV